MNNVRHVKSPLTDEKTTGQEVSLAKRLNLNLSTGCFPPAHSNCLPHCQSATLALCHSAAAASSCPSIILYLHRGFSSAFLSLSLSSCLPTYTFSQ